ncbi:site-specific integrase [Yersinia ruckeri]|uniref:site-specific integrase n=1 Tax=Yersinia ruckeri TaxID=29486 RepID=UPI00223803C9|nr:site-specific integrase [Yersinia ruckeri]HDL6786971.1 site-specific integrase [Yersinia enterocolitica]MCW6560085.1 site-specific integrase [Yersinia ruckeri]MCW6595988.1 site-specific integrase [Yersinia ruckeri]HDM8387114.1 site-specific integrase [Yersinia enterocolitica]HEN3490828.1 site-specific integrase [Yersinia enterocolitica]
MKTRVKNIQLSKALDIYLDKISFFKKGGKQEQYRVNTIKKYKISRLLTNNITSVDIAEYRDERLKTIKPNGKTISSNTVRLELALLSHLFKVGIVEWGIARENPVLLVRKPKVSEGRNRRIQPAEHRKLIRYANEHSSGDCTSIINFAIETAMRQGEILALQWEHIDLRHGVAHLPVTKNGTSRDVPLSAKARDILRKCGPRLSGSVFSYTSNGFKSAWRVIIIRSGINDLHFHDLRHEAISRFVESGRLNIMEVSAISGHKSLSMLKRYTHLKASDLTKKLDKKKSRYESITSVIQPYSATIAVDMSRVKLQFCDFDDFVIDEKNYIDAVEKASSSLLKMLCMMLKNGEKIPNPSLPPYGPFIMIDPLNVNQI